MASSNRPPIILFCYEGSPYSRRMDYYLQLRNLPYKRCMQRPNLPRPDLERLGVNYRRIPIVSIGRDVYCDTRIIIEKLETLLPDGALGSRAPFEKGLEKLLESWIIDAGPFTRTSGCIPPNAPLMRDAAWVKDRQEGSGGKFVPKALERARPENIAHLRLYFNMLEEGLLGDGREYIFGTQKPSLGDVHAIWCFDWGINLIRAAGRDAVGADVINEQTFPRVYAWVKRFRVAHKTAVERNGAPDTVASDETIEGILANEYFEREGDVDSADPLRLVKGQRVKVSPIDFGFTHTDEGRLIALSLKEIAIEKEVPGGQGCLRLHFPRSNFRVLGVSEGPRL